MANKRPNTKQTKELKRKTAVVARRLKKRFGSLERPGLGDPLESMIVTILSQNTNDVNRDRAYRSLRNAFPTWELMLEAPPSRIARAIRVGGLSKQKSKYIKDLLKWVKQTYGKLSLDAMRDMTVEEAVRVFTQHKGIGLKTVYVTLMFTCGKDVFPVDTHIYRIVRRLGLVPEKLSRDGVTEWMQVLIPKGRAFEFHIHLIRFGREVCKARRPLCYDCPFTRTCRYTEKTLTPPGNPTR